MTKVENKKIILQVIPAMEMGGAEAGTIEVSTYMNKKGWKTFLYKEINRSSPFCIRAKTKKLTPKAQKIKFFKNSYIGSSKSIKNISRFRALCKV